MYKQSAPVKYTLEQLWLLFQHWLSSDVIEQRISEYCLAANRKRGFYQRLFPPLVILWGFIFQRLNSDHTCDEFVSQINGQEANPRRSESTAGYCKARQRLPVSIAQDALRLTAHALQAEWGETGLWRGFSVSLFDGSTLRLKATEQLSDHYQLPSNQHGPSHWPTMRLVGGFDLFSGALWDVAEGSYGTGEVRLACNLIQRMGPGFLHVGDCNFGVYHVFQVIAATASQALIRLKEMQAKSLLKTGLQSGCDLDFSWSPSKHDVCEPGLEKNPISGRLIYVRLNKAGFRPIDLYLFTTLTDREAYSLQALIDLYGQRWQAELDLRHVKTTLDMEGLDGKSVDIVRKELYLGVVAYNLIRGWMNRAAQLAQRKVLELSLASSWRRIRYTFENLSPTATADEIQAAVNSLLVRLGQCALPKRKSERFEPRAVRGKPRNFPIIKGSRELARQEALAAMMLKS